MTTEQTQLNSVASSSFHRLVLLFATPCISYQGVWSQTKTTSERTTHQEY